MKARRGEWIKVPHDLLEVRSSTSITVWVILARYRRYSDTTAPVRPSRATVQTALGHYGLDPKSVTLSTNALEQLGWLKKEHYHRSTSARVNYYLDVPQRSYEQLDARVLALVKSRELTPEDLVWFLRWQRACGGAGWTADSAWEMGERYGVTSKTVKRHRSRLVALGLLVDEPRPGVSSITRTHKPDDLGRLLDEHLTGAAVDDDGLWAEPSSGTDTASDDPWAVPA